jgi:exopolyphosphatase / guanosine-5'-triphosphate,3'-diphosphate pyrophosphatase
MRIAILDIGTNTFNLLIADITDQNTYEIKYKSKLPVKLAKGGMNERIIAEDAFERGMEALRFHYRSIRESKVDEIIAYATSAIRSSSNGEAFVKAVTESFGINIQVISGNREAELIYRGVAEAVKLTDEKVLIMDIGGGSTEFVVADKQRIYWKHSFELGIARQLERFRPGDPISDNEIIVIESFLESQLHAMFNELKPYGIKTLIGSSGSFDSFANIISIKRNNLSTFPQSTGFEIKRKEFDVLYFELIKSNFAQRTAMEGLEAIRVEMIVLAAIFVNLIINKFGIVKIWQSEYAIKEGMLFETIDNIKQSKKEMYGKNISN